MDFRNSRDFNYINALVFNNLYKLPEDIDLVVGVPRSGLIISIMLAEFRSLPSTDLFSYINNIPVQKIAKESNAPIYDVTQAKHILLVDDAVGFGISMTNAKNLIQKQKNVKITTFAVFTEDYGKSKVDIYCSILKDQFLPWSVLKRSTPVACVDIDGVLTQDVPDNMNDDGQKYIQYLTNQKQMFVPDREIHTLVTGRLEKYRTITEDWLKLHNIRYRKLVMLNLQNNAERTKINVGEYKAAVYNASKLPLFIESSVHEATTIFNITHKPVFCTAACQMLF